MHPLTTSQINLKTRGQFDQTTEDPFFLQEDAQQSLEEKVKQIGEHVRGLETENRKLVIDLSRMEQLNQLLGSGV